MDDMKTASLCLNKFSKKSYGQTQRGTRGTDPPPEKSQVNIGVLVRTPREAIEPLGSNCFFREVHKAHFDDIFWIHAHEERDTTHDITTEPKSRLSDACWNK